MMQGLDYLAAQSFGGLMAIYWFVIFFEIPRYLLLFCLVALLPRRTPATDLVDGTSVSVVVVGHSEGRKVETCVATLREQSHRPDEIIVLSDGSTDDMAKQVLALHKRGWIDAAHATELRSGKAAGLNLGARLAKGGIIIFVDCDCTFDRHAIRNIVRPFADPQVGAVSGSVLVRNSFASLMTAFQAIEYVITISLGRQAMDRLGQVSCVSGAFGAFRRQAFTQIGGFDAEGGEDLDLTLSMRTAGWRIRFAHDAVCLTDVPVTVRRLIRQRGRWERDAVRLRFRKHAGMLNPLAPRFAWRELLHEAEFLLFSVIPAVILPFYVIWLFQSYGSFAFSILVAAQFTLMLMDMAIFLIGALVTPRAPGLRLVPFIPGFGLYYGVFMRAIRLNAYIREWVWHASNRDEFVPAKVLRSRGQVR